MFEFLEISKIHFYEEENKLHSLNSSIQVRPELTRDEYNALQEYVGPGVCMNRALRAGWLGLFVGKWKYSKYIKILDSMFANHLIDKPIKVYRGFGSDGQEILQKMKVGQVFSDRAFLSTSLNPKVAVGFAHGRHRVMRIMRIALPRGSEAIHVGRVGEYEVILPRNIKLRLLDIKLTYHRLHNGRPTDVILYEFEPIEG